MNPKLLGFIRTFGSVVVWAAITSALGWLTDGTHLSMYVSPSIAAIITGFAGMLEHSIEAKGKGALFGAVRSPLGFNKVK